MIDKKNIRKMELTVNGVGIAPSTVPKHVSPPESSKSKPTVNASKAESRKQLFYSSIPSASSKDDDMLDDPSYVANRKSFDSFEEYEKFVFGK